MFLGMHNFDFPQIESLLLKFRLDFPQIFPNVIIFAEI